MGLSPAQQMVIVHIDRAERDNKGGSHLFPKNSRNFLSLSLACAFWLSSSTVMAQNNESELYSHISRGNQYLRRLQFAEAIKEYEEALKVAPGNQVAKSNIALSHNNWGIALYQRKNFDEAAKQWQQALVIDPNNGDAKRNLVIMKNFLEQQSRSPYGSRGGTDMFSQAEEDAARRDYSKEAVSKPKEETQPSSIKILKSGSSSATTTPATGTNNNEGVATYNGTNFGGTAGNGVPTNSGTGNNSGAGNSSTGSSSGTVMTGSNTATTSGAGTTTTSSTATTSGTTTFGGTTSSSSSNPQKSDTSSGVAETGSFGAGTATGGTIEEALASLEIKVYGKKQFTGSLLSRLQQIEKDTLGKSGEGSIKFRIDTLRQTLGN